MTGLDDAGAAILAQGLPACPSLKNLMVNSMNGRRSHTFAGQLTDKGAEILRRAAPRPEAVELVAGHLMKV